MRVAALDLGTNTFLCLIAEISDTGGARTLKIIQDESRVVRLGEKVHEKRAFVPAALARAETCLKEFAAIIHKNNVDKVVATATSAARDAKNGHELIALGKALGIPIYIIEGEKEARLSFDGAVSGLAEKDPQALKTKNILVVDVGGGSTEMIFSHPGSKLKSTSFDVGCVRLTEMFLKSDPVAPNELAALDAYAKKTMAPYGRVEPDVIVAVAGTPTTLACVDQKIDFNESKVEGFILTREKLQELSKELGAMPLEKRKTVKGLDPLRADVIIAGCSLLTAALNCTNKNQMRVSTRGVRFGVALHYDEF